MLKIEHSEDIVVTFDDPREGAIIASAVTPPFAYICETAEEKSAAAEVFLTHDLEVGADVLLYLKSELDTPVPIAPPPQTYRTGAKVGMAELIGALDTFGFSRHARPEGDDFCVRGDTVDICADKKFITRIMFFDDEIEDIKLIDINTFQMISRRESVTIHPIPSQYRSDKFTSVLQNLKTSVPIIIINEPAQLKIWHTANENFSPVNTIKANLFSKQGEFEMPSVGDLVYYETRGLGKFAGVKTLDLGGFRKDYIILEYGGKTVVYVPIDQQDALYNYFGPHRRVDYV
jgi:transcription-repair coupling factor (superfamily II helicase)